jgi:hypothetical protein
MEDTMILADPSTLTTAQLIREISSLKELVFVRLNAIEQGIEVSHADFVRVPTEVQRQVGSLKELMEAKISGSDELKQEKFKNLDKRLDLVEQARIEQKKDTATAVDAALKAAKEAVAEQNASNVLAINKSEASITKQIDQQADLIRQISKSFDEKISDIKERLGKGDGKTQGGKDVMDIIKLVIVVAGFILAYFVIKS